MQVISTGKENFSSLAQLINIFMILCFRIYFLPARSNALKRDCQLLTRPPPHPGHKRVAPQPSSLLAFLTPADIIEKAEHQ